MPQEIELITKSIYTELETIPLMLFEFLKYRIQGSTDIWGMPDNVELQELELVTNFTYRISNNSKNQFSLIRMSFKYSLNNL